jgi:hypothetical protein
VFGILSTEEFMADQMNVTTPKKDLDGESTEPVSVIRKGAIAASIWQRQSPSGFAYHDFSVSRSWKSLSTDRAGYSKNFFETNEVELIEVIQKASLWITQNRSAEVGTEKQAA